ncbi:MAG TPA: family 16 glycoside hydrolase [Candidatus Limnocylindria bacterium]|nr:family 16 glycoside hydrolase [Candidatus Limnocylindria bacterium]
MFSRPLLLLLLIPGAFAAERKFDFSEVGDRQTPTNFHSSVTGRGQPGEWKVLTDEVPLIVPPESPKSPVISKRAVLAQLSKDRDETRAPLFIFDGDSYADFTFNTRFKILSGEVEQMAGVAFRLQDEKNYYYVRANAKDQNVAFFRYVDGELIAAISQPAEVKRSEWNHLTVECRGSKLRALLNEREVLPWTEPNLIPFPDGTSKGVFSAGKIAFWTKADSVAYFTDAHIDYTPREPFAQVLIRETMHQNPRLLGLKIYGVNGKDPSPRVVASHNGKDLGEAGDTVEKSCIEKGSAYFGKGKELAVVTMPLHDRNGETVGAVRVEMTTFFGQTERNGLARAVPIVKSMEARISSAKDLLQ